MLFDKLSAWYSHWRNFSIATSAEFGRLPAGMELTLKLVDNSTAGLLLPAVH